MKDRPPGRLTSEGTIIDIKLTDYCESYDREARAQFVGRTKGDSLRHLPDTGRRLLTLHNVALR
jgi:hypothetical protein